MSPISRQPNKQDTHADFSYTEQALHTLKHAGLRITKPRKVVIDLLDNSPVPLSAYEIKEKIDSLGEKIDTVSVYRIIETLEKHHLIHRLLSSSKVQKCRLSPESSCDKHQSDHCHHLLVCSECHTVSEVHCPGANDLVQAVQQAAHFQITSHAIEFYGVCGSCSG
ncbi:MAG: transcriptional repressor [Cyanobacteria bacterium]|nr:transcriptional repressor [Cyanobacteriota bacterium]